MAGFLAAGSNDALTGLSRVAGPARIARTLSRRGGPKGWGCQPRLLMKPAIAVAATMRFIYPPWPKSVVTILTPLGTTDEGVIRITISPIFF